MDYREAYEYGEKLVFTSSILDTTIKYHEACQKALKMQVPQKIEIEKWCAAYCPNCDEELSTHHGDGYYGYPTHLDMCPYCGQKISW